MPDDRLDQLTAIGTTMPEAIRLSIEADHLKGVGQTIEAAHRYQQLVRLLSRQLRMIEDFDRQFPETPFGQGATVDQLLNAMLTEADLIETLGERPRAESLRETAMSLAARHHAVIDLADRNRQRAASLLAQARYHEAATALLQCRDDFFGRGRPVDAALVTAELGELYEWLGDYQRALTSAEQGLRQLEPFIGAEPAGFNASFAALAAGRFEEAQHRARLAAAHAKLIHLEARVLRSLRRFDEADVRFRSIQATIDPELRPTADFQLARNDIERGDLRRGLDLLETIPARMTGMLAPRLGAITSWLAEAHLALGNQAKALPFAVQSVEQLRSIGDDDSLWRAEWRKARALAASNRPEDARASYRAAVAAVDRMRRAPLGYRLESTFFADKAPLFDDAIRQRARAGDASECLALIERVKSRALTALLTVPQATPDGEGPLATAVDGLSTRLDALEYRGYRDGWDSDSLRVRASLLAERSALLEEIQLQDPRWRTLSRPRPFEPQAALEALATKRLAAISLYYQSGTVIGVLLAGGAVAVAATTLSADTQAALDGYGRNLLEPKPNVERLDPAWTESPLRADALIPSPLLERAAEFAGLVLVPHRDLHVVPWGATRFGNGRLFEHLAVTVLPNVSCIELLSPRRSPATGGAALIGAPVTAGRLADLTFAENEIFALESILGARVFAVATGPAATQARYRQLLSDPRGSGGILHLACHGEFVADAPDNSGLILSDGKLDASDIARRRIGFDEVVLSACASGRRPTRVGDLDLAADDIIGLPGAFLEAGARSVIVSIPPADDQATSILMERYYEGRVDGLTPGQALRRAQLDMLEARRFLPAIWAGFTAYGVD